METIHILKNNNVGLFRPQKGKSQFYHCPTWVLSLHKCSLSLLKWPYFRHWIPLWRTALTQLLDHMQIGNYCPGIWAPRKYNCQTKTPQITSLCAQTVSSEWVFCGACHYHVEMVYVQAVDTRLSLSCPLMNMATGLYISNLLTEVTCYTVNS